MPRGIDHNAYCRDRSAPPGSDLYYSLLALKDLARRQAIIAVHALKHELGAIKKISNADVARSKLNWWREELQRLYYSQARHPITLSLSQPVQHYRLPQAEFLTQLEGVAMDLDYNAYPDFESLRFYCERSSVPVYLLQARIAGYKEPRTLTFAHDTGIALALTERLIDVRTDAQYGYFYIPEQDLERFALSHQDFLQGTSSAALHALFKHCAERAGAYWRSALQSLPAHERYHQRALVILAELAMTLLDEIEADGFALLQQRIRLTAIRKLWITWRMLRREKAWKNHASIPAYS